MSTTTLPSFESENDIHDRCDWNGWCLAADATRDSEIHMCRRERTRDYVSHTIEIHR